MYLYEPIDRKYYEVTNTQDFKKYLDTIDLETIKTLFKSTYLEQCLNDTYDELEEAGWIEKSDGNWVDMKDTIIFFKNYLYVRFGESVYKVVISNFEAAFDHRMKVLANPSLMN